MRLLLTRPEADSAPLRQRLEALGHTVMVEPLLAIEPVAFELPDPPPAAILLTSRHGAGRLGAARLGATELSRATPVYCVGRATAEAARHAGFADVRAGDGNAADLARLVIAERAPGAGPLLHLRGKATRGGLAETLRRAGLDVREAIVYEARASAGFTQGLAEAIGSGGLDGALFFSPRTARIFAAHVASLGLAEPAARITAYCLSNAVADELAGLAMPTRIAPTPDLDALVGLIAPASP